MGIYYPALKIMMLMSLVVSTSPIQLEAPQARIMVVGDIMMHTPVIYSGYDYKTHGYNYDSIFSEVKPVFDKADLVIGNLETPVSDDGVYSGYPRFEAPHEIVSSLKYAGFDVLTTANNHSMDQWEDGVVETINHLDNYNIFHTGTFKSEEDRKPLVIDVNGIKIGIIASTYGTNGLPVPDDKPYLVNMLDIKTIEHDIKALKEQQVDYIMAMIHFGNEYQRIASPEQEEWTKTLYELGVDFVLGSHPHVVQPLNVDKSQSAYENDKGVIYSMGNFISNQRWGWKDYGIILDIVLEKDVITNKVKIKSIDAIPTYVEITRNTKTNYRIIPISDENENLNEEIKNSGDELLEHVFQYK